LEIWNFFFTESDPAQKGLGWNRPKIKRAYFLQGWTQPSRMGWADVPARNEHRLVIVHEHSNQLSNQPEMCTVHVLHARRWTTEGDKGKNYLWWWAWIDGLTVVLVADLAVVLLRPSSSSSLRFSSALFASVSVSSFCFSRGCCRLGGQWQLAVMLVAVERNPTMPHGGYEGGSG